jgi:hypothetical protein
MFELQILELEIGHEEIVLLTVLMGGNYIPEAENFPDRHKLKGKSTVTSVITDDFAEPDVSGPRKELPSNAPEEIFELAPVKLRQCLVNIDDAKMHIHPLDPLCESMNVPFFLTDSGNLIDYKPKFVSVHVSSISLLFVVKRAVEKKSNLSGYIIIF